MCCVFTAETRFIARSRRDTCAPSARAKCYSHCITFGPFYRNMSWCPTFMWNTYFYKNCHYLIRFWRTRCDSIDTNSITKSRSAHETSITHSSVHYSTSQEAVTHQFSGYRNVGGGLLGILSSTRAGCRSWPGGFISASSSCVIPNDQTSACRILCL